MNEINDSDLDMLLEDLALEEEISGSDESMKWYIVDISYSVN